MGQQYREEMMENNNDPFAPIPFEHQETEKALHGYEVQHDNNAPEDSRTKEEFDNPCHAFGAANDEGGDEGELNSVNDAYRYSPIPDLMSQRHEEGLPHQSMHPARNVPEARQHRKHSTPPVRSTGHRYGRPSTSYEYDCIHKSSTSHKRQDRRIRDREWIRKNDGNSSGDINMIDHYHQSNFAKSNEITPPEQHDGSPYFSRPPPSHIIPPRKYYIGQTGNMDVSANYHQVKHVSSQPPSPLYQSPPQHNSYFARQPHDRSHYYSPPSEGLSRASARPLSPPSSYPLQFKPYSYHSAPLQEEKLHPASATHPNIPPFSPLQPMPYGRPNGNHPFMFVPQYYLVPSDSPLLSNTAKRGELSSTGMQIGHPMRTVTFENSKQFATEMQSAKSVTDTSNVLQKDTPDPAAVVPGVGGYEGSKAEQQLVQAEDRYLITDYNFFMMRQLRLCQLTETDKKIRGGKRENIELGFPGLQCMHCANATNPRKFYWRNVDRLSNSFVEIPTHVLKCKHCPRETKDALLRLKAVHHEQITQLPRGAQKIFFRRIWRRMHSTFKSLTSSPEAVPTPPEAAVEGGKNSTQLKTKSATLSKEDSPKAPNDVLKNDSQVGFESSITARPLSVDRDGEDSVMLVSTAQEAAKALADSANLTSSSSSGPSEIFRQRILLALPEDMEWLSDMDCFMRKQIEVFCATREDIECARSNRELFPTALNVGQIGIRCIHCALRSSNNSNNKDKPPDSGFPRGAVAYPRSIRGIYQSVRDIQRTHLNTCENLPKEVKERLSDLNGCTSLSSFLRKYYVFAAGALGLKNTQRGIQATGKSVPLGAQPAISFSERTLRLPGEMGDGNRKRKSQFPSKSDTNKKNCEK